MPKPPKPRRAARLTLRSARETAPAEREGAVEAEGREGRLLALGWRQLVVRPAGHAFQLRARGKGRSRIVGARPRALLADAERPRGPGHCRAVPDEERPVGGGRGARAA